MAEHDDREQRTEEATPRRREEARERGQVALSTELVAALGLLSGLGFLALGGAELAQTLGGQIQSACTRLGELGCGELTPEGAAGVLWAGVQTALGALALVVLPTVFVTCLTGFAQVGFRLAPKALEMDPAKLDPMRGLQKVLSARAFARTGLSIAKVALIFSAAAWVAWSHVDEIAGLGGDDLGPLLLAVGTVVLRTTAAALAAILFLAILDAVFQRIQHERDLRMTRAEVREEQRLTDGDPHVRARIRALQRELAMRRMMADVPKATVVVTNPTHYAVALRYDREGREGREERPGARSAPLVVAKGVDHLAERIKEIAAQHGVVRHEDVRLARTLYAKVKVGQEIPEELYGAVAAVLATVYRLESERAPQLETAGVAGGDA